MGNRLDARLVAAGSVVDPHYAESYLVVAIDEYEDATPGPVPAAEDELWARFLAMYAAAPLPARPWMAVHMSDHLCRAAYRVPCRLDTEGEFDKITERIEILVPLRRMEPCGPTVAPHKGPRAPWGNPPLLATGNCPVPVNHVQ